MASIFVVFDIIEPDLLEKHQVDGILLAAACLGVLSAVAYFFAWYGEEFPLPDITSETINLLSNLSYLTVVVLGRESSSYGISAVTIARLQAASALSFVFEAVACTYAWYAAEEPKGRCLSRLIQCGNASFWCNLIDFVAGECVAVLPGVVERALTRRYPLQRYCTWHARLPASSQPRRTATWVM